MTRTGEFSACLGIAILAHVGLWIQFGPSGVQSQGAAGQASVSLVASSDDMADRVAAWTRPVEVMPALPSTPVAPPAPDMPAAAPPAARTPDPRAALPMMPQPAPVLPDAPASIDIESAAPASLRHAPRASFRPRPRAAPKPDPRAKTRGARTASTPSRSQKARGGQSGTDAGNTQSRQSASISDATRRSLMARWGASIRNQVERRKRYPSGTTASGTTMLRITVSRAGRLQALSVIRSSGDRRLDQAAIGAVQKARYAAAPAGLDAAQYSFNLPLAFRRK